MSDAGMTGDEDWAWVDGDDSEWVPPAADPTTPNIARMYDYGLGGKDNYLVDRQAAERMLQVAPEGRQAALANRRFLVDVVQSMAADGIRQFIDLGTGIPTSPSVHETAWAIHPDTAIVYVDNDSVVLAHNRALMASEPRVVVLSQDLREPAAVLDHPEIRALVDFTAPVGLLMISVLHFVDVVAAPAIVARYLRDLAPGSQLAISAASSHGMDTETVARATRAYEAGHLVFRTWAELQALFDRLDMIRPLADVYRFQSSGGAMLGGIGRKP